MAERRDEILAVTALGLVTALLVAQGAVVAVATVAPLAAQAYDLTSEDAAVEVTPDETPRRGPWWALSMGMTAGSVGLGIWALLRLQRGTHVRGRWMWVLVLAGLASVWGIFAWRMLAALTL